MNSRLLFACLFAFAMTTSSLDNDALAQPAAANYDEAKVSDYTLPDPLKFSDGQPVENAQDWRERRRGEILKLFETEMFGRSPGKPDKLDFETVEVERKALGGTAVRKQVIVWFDGKGREPKMDLLIYQPAGGEGPWPTFLGLNFGGNQAIHKDPGIRLNTGWHSNDPKDGYIDHRATNGSRGAEASRWAVEEILKRGYAVATAYYGDIDPDYDDGFQNGVHPLFYAEGQSQPAPDEWGSIAAWAWGLSRAMDYFETDDEIDAKKVAVLGHSRLGKTALWAGATDERFAIVISNNSGCGGAALSRRIFGETVHRINTSFPHWFCDNFNKYSGKESELPIDQHMLIALAAPRPVYVASATEDLWADPKGEFLGLKHAEPVYQLLGAGELPADEMPKPNTPVMSKTMGYHLRQGKHDVTLYDWQRYMDFADQSFK